MDQHQGDENPGEVAPVREQHANTLLCTRLDTPPGVTLPYRSLARTAVQAKSFSLASEREPERER